MVPFLLSVFSSATQALKAHPHRVVAVLGTVLLGTGVTAFGIAPLAPDAADLPIRQVLQAVQLEATPALALGNTPVNGAPESLVLYRHDQTRRDDTVGSLLQRLGVNDPQAAAFLRTTPQARGLLSGRAGKLVAAQTDGHQSLVKLTFKWAVGDDTPQFNKLVVERTPSGFKATASVGTLTAATRMGSGTIQTSLFAATDAVGLPDPVANQLAEIFSADIDFRRDLRRGDRFSVIYESLEAEGEPLRMGRVLTAEFVNAGKALRSLWFQEPGSKGGYYSFDGQSKRRSYLASPLAFSRVSSGYGMRFHPVSGGIKAHLGVDFAAPTGTPVRAVGDGVVDFAASQRGYGNVVVLSHRNGHTTAYAHLSRILVRKGQRVEQGVLVGEVGSTGVSTGPHLHFEFRDNGVHKDPLTLAKQGEAVPVSTAARPVFNAVSQRMAVELTAAAQYTTASAE
jgi:murein DD-endopeptidase MepM/ murein hydrolase activator NlpD